MKESAKRVIDCLALAPLGSLIGFIYIYNSRPSKLWIALLMLDIPFSAAALIWLGGRAFSYLLREERTKRIIDWISVLLCVIEITLTWFFIYSERRVGKISASAIIMLVNFIPFMYAFFYLIIRCVRAATRVFGEKAVSVVLRKELKFIGLVAGIFLSVLAKALAIHPPPTRDRAYSHQGETGPCAGGQSSTQSPGAGRQFHPEGPAPAGVKRAMTNRTASVWAPVRAGPQTVTSRP